MLSKISIAMMLATALFVAPMRVSAAACILSNAPSEKMCQPDCCANKACCETSHERTGPSVQPLAKAGSDYKSIATNAPAVAAAPATQLTATKLLVLLSAECVAHSPPPLALICIRLI